MTTWLITLRKTCADCPMQWEGVCMSTGRQFYARARHGRFEAYLSDPGGIEYLDRREGEPGGTGRMMLWADIDLIDETSAWSARLVDDLSPKVIPPINPLLKMK